MGTGLSQIASRLLRDERGATAIEYGLIAALIFLVLLSAATLVGTNTVGMWQAVSSAIVAAMNG